MTSETVNSRRSFVALPYLSLVVGVLAMSMSGIFVKWANAPGLYRMLIAIAVFALPVTLRIKIPVNRAKPGQAQ